MPVRHPLIGTAVLPAVLLCQATAFAQSRQVKQVELPALPAPPTLDGRIDTREWTGAAQVDDLHEVVPVEYSKPRERTLWYLGYDERALYVAAHAYDRDPDAIVANSLSQGSGINSDDSLRILVDAFNTKRSGYVFGLNPNGVRYDAIFADATQQSDDWDGIWRGAARRTDDGWQMEMAIPFNTLNFDPDNGVWGLNLWREIARFDETIAWQSQNGRINPTVSGEMVGLGGLTQGKGIDVIPSVSSTYLSDRVADRSETDVNPSLDISYKLANAVNALVTFNTDFAATEVDNRQLGLQRFSLFFPEKRSFFLTDFDIFQFGGVPADSDDGPIGVQSGTNGLAFFSRRIGLSASREPVDILFGTKLSGRLGGYDFGALFIRQDDSGGLGEQNLGVARIVRPLLAESTVGFIGTFGDPQSDLDSSLLGIDFLYRNTRLPGNRTLENQWWVQQSDNDGIDARDRAWNVSVSLPARAGWSAGAQYQQIEEDFRPALGFANRTGVRLYSIEGGYNHVLDEPVRLQEVETQFRASRWEFLDSGRVQSQQIELELPRLRSVNGDFTRLKVEWQKEGLLPGEQPLDRIGIVIPDGEYSFRRYSAFLRTAGHRPLSAELLVEDGGFFNGDRLRIRPEIEWRPNEHLGFELEYDFNRFEFPGVSAITRQVTAEADVAFSSRLSLASLVQFDNISDDVGINLRLRFNVEAGRDLWFVLNHNMVEDPLENRFNSTQTAAAFKIRYTFRY